MGVEAKNRTDGAMIGTCNGRVEDEFSARTSMIAESLEEIFHSTAKDFYICQVLSGYVLPPSVNTKKLVSLYNAAYVIDLGDGRERWALRIRDITDSYFKKGIAGFCDGLPNPDGTKIEQTKEMFISFHPLAYTSDLSVMPNYGSVVVVRKIDGDYFIDTSINPSSGFSPGRAPSGTPLQPSSLNFNDGKKDINKETAEISALSKKYGLKPRKGVYSGKATPQPVAIENGYPAYFGKVTKLPSQEHANTRVFGKGHLLIDFVPSFERLAAAFHAHFGTKLTCSALRDFKGQIAARGQTIKNRAGCTSYSQKYGKTTCGTAIPGTSPHGWGIAIDIYYSRTGKGRGSHIKKRKNGNGKHWFDWMTANAHKYDWEHPGWAAAASGIEDHHWQPKKSLVQKVISSRHLKK